MEHLIKITTCTALVIFLFHGKVYAGGNQFHRFYGDGEPQSQSQAQSSAKSYTKSHGQSYEQRPLYFGGDLEYSHYRLKGNYTSLLKKKYPGANIYLGWRPHHQYGLELGYSFTVAKGKTTDFASGQVVAGNTTAVGAASVNTKIRMKNTHLDGNFYFDTGFSSVDRLDAILSVGVGFMRQKITTTVAPSSSNLVNVFDVKGKTNIIPRLGIGLDGMISKNWGMRGMVRYQHLSGVSVRDNGKVLGDKPFRDSLTFAIGFYRHFAY